MNKKLKVIIILFSVIIIFFLAYKMLFYYIIKNGPTNSFNIDSKIFNNNKRITIESKILDKEDNYYKFENLKIDKNILNGFNCILNDDNISSFEIKDDNLNVVGRIYLKKTRNFTYLSKEYGNKIANDLFDKHIFLYNISKDIKNNNITNDYLLYKYIISTINKGIKPTSSYYNMEKYFFLWSIGIFTIEPDLVNMDNNITIVYDNSNNYLGYIIKYKPTKDKENSKMTKIHLESSTENYEIILYTNNENIFNFDDDSIKEFISTVQIEK